MLKLLKSKRERVKALVEGKTLSNNEGFQVFLNDVGRIVNRELEGEAHNLTGYVYDLDTNWYIEEDEFPKYLTHLQALKALFIDEKWVISDDNPIPLRIKDGKLYRFVNGETVLFDENNSGDLLFLSSIHIYFSSKQSKWTLYEPVKKQGYCDWRTALKGMLEGEIWMCEDNLAGYYFKDGSLHYKIKNNPSIKKTYLDLEMILSKRWYKVEYEAIN